MTCPCKQKTKNETIKEVNSLVNTSLREPIVISQPTTPYTSCIFCTTKHLAYAQALWSTDKDRCVVNLYLAYLHSKKQWQNLATAILDIIYNFFKNIDIADSLDVIVHKAHALAIAEDTYEDLGVDLYLKLSKEQTALLFVLTARELYDFEVGYKHINTPYVIGFLQLATNFLPIHLRSDCRAIWKLIENKAFVLPKFNELIDKLKSGLVVHESP